MREKGENTENMMSEYFLFLSREDASISVGKKHIYIHAGMGRQIGRRVKPSKTSNSIVVTSFIYFPFSIQYTVKDQKEKKPVKGHMLWWQGMVSVVLWAGAELIGSRGAGAHSPHPWGPCTRGHPILLAQPAGESHTAIICVGCCCPQGSPSLPPPPFHPCAAHLFPHLSACCHSVQQTGEVTCVKITLSSTKANSYF